jgi:hypothetical protein
MNPKIYYPYKSDRKDKKYFIITNEGNKVYFGDSKYSDYTTHNDETRKKNYITRHKKRETWTKDGINTPGFWSRWLLWNKPSIYESYEDIKENYL